MVKALLVSLAFMSIGTLGTGCSGSTSASVRPVIIMTDGVWGYYTGNLFCNYYNDYCGTGLSYGITNYGCYYNGNYCPISGPIDPIGISIGTGLSNQADTKDVNLQRAVYASEDFEQRAISNSQQFSMNLEKARSLTQLSDRMKLLSSQGQLTDEDRDAIAHSALAVAGVNSPEIGGAIAKLANHDRSAVDALLEKAATNLGMTSSIGLREQILPSLGVEIPK